MSTTPSPTSALLNVLTSLNGGVQLGVTIGNVVVPLIAGVIKSIKTGESGQTVEYTVVIQTEQAVLDSIIAAGASDLAAINAELVRMGLAPLPVPTPPSAPAA